MEALSKKGFSLIETLIAVMILGILAGVCAPTIFEAVQNYTHIKGKQEVYSKLNFAMRRLTKEIEDIDEIYRAESQYLRYRKGAQAYQIFPNLGYGELILRNETEDKDYILIDSSSDYGLFGPSFSFTYYNQDATNWTSGNYEDISIIGIKLSMFWMDRTQGATKYSSLYTWVKLKKAYQ